MKDKEIAIALITSPEEDAERIAGELVDRGLAACCNIVAPVTSIYTWEGSRRKDTEALIVAKTTEEASPDLVEAVKSMHSYDLPEVILLAVVGGLEGYLEWVAGACRPGTKSG